MKGCLRFRAEMLQKAFLFFVATLAAGCACTAAHGGEVPFIREDFADLSAWKEVFFPKINRHTLYGIERAGADSYLAAKSEASASLIVFKRPFDVYEYSKVRFRWMISNTYAKADPRKKEGDDYPIRVYIAFQYEPEKASMLERAMYSAAKLVYGEYPPLRSLNYVWASRPEKERTIVSTYTDRSVMILLEAGAEKAGQWVEEEVDILTDYRKAFGKPPPRLATIGIMNDSDNTGERSTSYMDYIEVFK
jgi:hypothetical protein